MIRVLQRALFFLALSCNGCRAKLEPPDKGTKSQDHNDRCGEKMTLPRMCRTDAKSQKGKADMAVPATNLGYSLK